MDRGTIPKCTFLMKAIKYTTRSVWTFKSETRILPLGQILKTNRIAAYCAEADFCVCSAWSLRRRASVWKVRGSNPSHARCFKGCDFCDLPGQLMCRHESALFPSCVHADTRPSTQGKDPILHVRVRRVIETRKHQPGIPGPRKRIMAA